MARKPQPLKSIRSLVLLGAGKMGSAMLEGWLARGLNPKKITVLEPQPNKAVKALTRRGLKLNPKGKAAPASVIVVAVKPQIAADAVPLLAAYVGKGTLIVSIMAGRTIGFLHRTCRPIRPSCARCPIRRRRSAAASAAPSQRQVIARQRKQAADLLAAIGTVEWVSNEALMDAVTAVSGSGPAYVFLLAEAMTKAGIAAGLPADLAARLARETVAGSGELLHCSDLDAATLRQNVTSPGGTTAAALEVLMGPGGFDELLTKAIAAATRRGRELAGRS